MIQSLSLWLWNEMNFTFGTLHFTWQLKWPLSVSSGFPCQYLRLPLSLSLSLNFILPIFLSVPVKCLFLFYFHVLTRTINSCFPCFNTPLFLWIVSQTLISLSLSINAILTYLSLYLYASTYISFDTFVNPSPYLHRFILFIPKFTPLP